MSGLTKLNISQTDFRLVQCICVSELDLTWTENAKNLIFPEFVLHGILFECYTNVSQTLGGRKFEFVLD